MKDDNLWGPFGRRLNLIFALGFCALAGVHFGRWIVNVGDTSALDWMTPAFIAFLEYRIVQWKRRAAVWFDLCRDHGFVSRKGL